MHNVVKMVKINELNSGQGSVEVEGTIKEFGEPRTFNKFGRELTVVNAVLEDDSGTVKLSLWNEDATRFKVGDKVKITNGYVSEFQGEPQLTSGKFGSIEKLEGSLESVKEDKKEEGDTPQENVEGSEEPVREPGEEDIEVPNEEDFI